MAWTNQTALFICFHYETLIVHGFVQEGWPYPVDGSSAFQNFDAVFFWAPINILSAGQKNRFVFLND
jgi:hypothetical protein